MDKCLNSTLDAINLYLSSRKEKQKQESVFNGLSHSQTSSKLFKARHVNNSRKFCKFFVVTEPKASSFTSEVFQSNFKSRIWSQEQSLFACLLHCLESDLSGKRVFNGRKLPGLLKNVNCFNKSITFLSSWDFE